jgi:hypothetical protein
MTGDFLTRSDRVAHSVMVPFVEGSRASLSTLERAGRELLDSGTLRFLDGAIAYADLQRRFGS